MNDTIWPSDEFELVRYGEKHTVLQKKNLYDGKCLGHLSQKAYANKERRYNNSYWEIVEKNKYEIGDKLPETV